MHKDSYRIIFEGHFDNAVTDSLVLVKARKPQQKFYMSYMAISLLANEINTAYTMDIISFEESRFLKRAICAIFSDEG